jgi:hypothetical protein
MFREVVRASARGDEGAIDTEANASAAEAIFPRERRNELLAVTTETATRFLAEDLGKSVSMNAGQSRALTDMWNGVVGRLRE